LEEATVGRSGEEISAVGAGCPVPREMRLERDIRWRIASSGNSNLTSRSTRGGTYRNTSCAVACLGSGLGFAVGHMCRVKDCWVEGEIVEVIAYAREE
jgi:hypothetical protein